MDIEPFGSSQAKVSAGTGLASFGYGKIKGVLVVPTAPLLAIALRLSSGCIAPGEYPVVDTAVDPGINVRSAKVYFRSDTYPKFYYIEMKPSGAGLRSVLPRPSPETERIVYYIETVDVAFTSVVSAEQVLEVRIDCVEEEKAEEVASVPPEITVGSVEAGGPAIPPGFEAAGIIGTIASTGVLTGLGGGSSIGTAIVVGGLAAAGTSGVVVAASGGEQEAPPGSDGSSPTTTSTRPTTTTTTATVTTTTTTAAVTTTTTTVPASVSACFSSSFPGNSCNLKLDAGCSKGPITSWDWVIDPGSAFGGPTSASGPTVNRTFPQCAGETVLVTLTVNGPGGASDAATQAIKLPVSQRQSLRELELVSCTFTSFLSSRELSGSVVLDRVRLENVPGGISVRHVLRAHPGEHEVEAFLTATEEGEALWTFDFSSCEALFTSGLEPRQGQVIASGGRRIAFRLTGTGSEHLQFRFRLSR
ncbi:MAG: hypothetical protein ACRD1Z_00385 [Vicinamibacteria bacterium]